MDPWSSKVWLSIALLSLGGMSRANDISGLLFNTGVDAARHPLAPGTLDPHYTLEGGTAYACTPFGPWLTPGPTASWDNPSGNSAQSFPTISYRYHFQLDLTGYDASTAMVAGRWSADDQGYIYLNGTLKASSFGFQSLTNFSLQGFKAGVNDLEFVAYNSGGSQTGVVVEFTSGLANPASGLASLTLAPTSVVGGSPATGTVTLFQPAGASGTVVSLSNNGSSVVAVPASVTMPSGAVTATFPITTYGTGYIHAGKITASVGASSVSAYLTVDPASLQSVSIPATISAGTSASGRVTLNGRAGPALQVSLSSNNVALYVPPSVTVPANSPYSPPFPIQTSLVPNDTSVIVNASAGGASQTSITTVVYSSFLLLLSATTTGSGQNISGTVSLANPAPASGSTIRLWNDGDAFYAVPGSVTVPSGQSSAAFVVSVYGVNAPTLARVVATSGALSRMATFTVLPATLQSVQLSQVILTGGGSTTGRAFLSGPNGTKGQTVALASNNAAVTLPPGATVPPDGHDTFAFTVTTMSVSSTQTATISATLNGVTKTATLTVNPG